MAHSHKTIKGILTSRGKEDSATTIKSSSRYIFPIVIILRGKRIHSVFSIPAHPFGGLVLQVFFGQFGLVDAGIWLLTQNFEGLSCWYIFGA